MRPATDFAVAPTRELSAEAAVRGATSFWEELDFGITLFDDEPAGRPGKLSFDADLDTFEDGGFSLEPGELKEGFEGILDKFVLERDIGDLMPDFEVEREPEETDGFIRDPGRDKEEGIGNFGTELGVFISGDLDPASFCGVWKRVPGGLILLGPTAMADSEATLDGLTRCDWLKESDCDDPKLVALSG